MKKLLSGTAIALALALGAHAAEAAIAVGNSAVIVGSYGTSNSVSYTVNSASNELFVQIQQYDTNPIQNYTVTYNGQALTKVCGGSTASNGEVVYHLDNPPAGAAHDIVITSPSSEALEGIAIDYSGTGGIGSCYPNLGSAYGNTSFTSTGTITQAGSWMVIAATGTAGDGTHPPTAGSGDVLRLDTSPNTDPAWFDSNGALSVGSHSFTTTEGGVGGTAIGHLDIELKAAVTGPTPVSAQCLPAAPTLPDNSASGSQVCAFQVTMSDGSTYTGTNAVMPSATFAVPGTGNGNLTLASGLSSSQDGQLSAAMNFTENGGTVALTVPVTVTPPTISGTPFVVGWKNIDPGAGADGQTIMIAPHVYTVDQIVGEPIVPASGSALVDVFHALPGQSCSSGMMLHTGDFNAAGLADQPQPLPLASTVSATGNLNSSNSITGVSAGISNFKVGMALTDSTHPADIPANTFVTAVGSNTITLSQAATATVSGDTLVGNPLVLNVQDRLCLSTHSGFPTTGQAVIEVTAQ